MQTLMQKRLRQQLQHVEDQQEFGRLDSSIIRLGPVVDANGNQKLTEWSLKFAGRPGSFLHPGKYEVKMIFKDFPQTFPECTFQRGFEHYHVFQKGSICLPLLKASNWNTSIRITQLAVSIINMVHNEPTVGDDANSNMGKLYDQSKEAYYRHLKEQAKRFQNY